MHCRHSQRSKRLSRSARVGNRPRGNYDPKIFSGQARKAHSTSLCLFDCGKDWKLQRTGCERSEPCSICRFPSFHFQSCYIAQYGIVQSNRWLICEIWQNIRRIESNKDRQEAAILIFTIITVIFLPLSFVSSFFGMNTSDIRNLRTPQWIFWACAIPLTAIVIGASLLMMHKIEPVRELWGRYMDRNGPENTAQHSGFTGPMVPAVYGPQVLMPSHSFQPRPSRVLYDQSPHMRRRPTHQPYLEED